MKFLRSKILFGKQERFLRSCLPLFPFRLSLFSLFLFITSVAACAADKGAILLKDLKAGNYDFFLKADNAAYRSVKMMGRGSAYYVGLHLKRTGYEQAARFYFALGEKHYEAPLNRLCREALYETGSPVDRLQSVQKRLQELAGTPAAFGQEDTVQAEKERLSLLEIQLLLQTGAYGNITQSPETLYLTGPLTAELADAFPYFGKDLPSFLYKLAEARIAVFEKRYAEAWSSVQEAFGIEHTFASLSSPALLSDIGKAGVYGAENSADAAAFFGDFAAQVRSAAAEGHISDGDERRYLFYALFYEARCRTKIGGAAQREQAVKLFLQAAELAGSASDFDSAMWYYLDTMRMLGLSRYLKALANTAARWKSPAWYADLVQSLRAQLTAAKDWKNLETLYAVLAKTTLPEQRAAVAYTLACAGQLPPDRTARLLQEAAGESHDALYYRILGTYRLGGAQLLEKTFQFRSVPLSGKRTQSNTSQVQSGAQAQADEANTQSGGYPQTGGGKAKTNGFSPQEAQTYIDGLLHFGLYDMVYPRIVAVYPSISAEEALQIARTLAGEGRYADSIRVIRFSLKNQEDAATKEQLELLYPRPWRELVSKYAAEYGLPEYLLYALIRSESFFQPQVVSGAGAVGLTQLMPATAADIAKKLKVADYRLTDPEINIRFGAYYLAEMIRRSDNRIMPACFAYNAGISRVRGWQKKAQGLPEDLFLESLEYAETRDYGRKLLSAATVYGVLYYSEEPEDIVRLFFKELL